MLFFFYSLSSYYVKNIIYNFISFKRFVNHCIVDLWDKYYRILKLFANQVCTENTGKIQKDSILIFFFFLFLAKATFEAIAKTYGYLTPDLWRDVPLSRAPYAEFSDHLLRNHNSKVLPVDE